MNVDPLPTGEKRFGRCPRCDRSSNFRLVLSNDILTVKPVGNLTRPLERVVVLRCPGCNFPMVIVEQKDDSPWDDRWKQVMYWPTPGAQNLDESIPDTVRAAYDEGVRCQAVHAPHAAVAMFRSALAQVVQDRGSEQAKNKFKLQDQIKQMIKDGHLPPVLGDWADHIRELGNAGAHPEVFGPVEDDEADGLRDLLDALLEAMYVQPANLLKRNQRRADAKAARAAAEPDA